MVNMLDKNNPATQKLVLDALANLLAAGEELGKAKGENEFTKVSSESGLVARYFRPWRVPTSLTPRLLSRSSHSLPMLSTPNPHP